MKINNLFNIKDKVALITGAAQGLGQGYAENLALSGCKCVCADLSIKKLEETIQIIDKIGGEAYPLEMDITKKESIEKGFSYIIDKFKEINIVVNNAGIEIAEPFLDVTQEHYDSIIEVNHKGTFFVTQEAAKYMKKQNRGKIINIASLGSFIGLKGSSVYCSSKGAVMQLTKTVAIELARYNIQVNAIAPGYFLTKMTKPFFENKEHKKWIEERIPIGKVGTTDDLAGTLIFLASDASNYITGQILVVDGGWLAS